MIRVAVTRRDDYAGVTVEEGVVGIRMIGKGVTSSDKAGYRPKAGEEGGDKRIKQEERMSEL